MASGKLPPNDEHRGAPGTPASSGSPQYTWPPARRVRASRRRHTSPVLRVVTVAAAGLALYLVFPALAQVIGAWPQLSTVRVGWLACAFVAEAASFVCSFALQRLVLRTKAWFSVVTAALAGNAVTGILPAGDAAGAAVQYHILATSGIDPDAAAGGLTAASLLGVGGLLGLPILTLPAVIGGSGVSPGLEHTALVGLVGFVLFAAGGIVVIATDRPLAVLGRIVQRVWNRFRGGRAPITGLDRRLLTERDAVVGALGHRWWEAVLLVVGRLGLDYLCLLAALRAVGSKPNPSLVLVAYTTAGVAALVPITPGGLGIVEASLSGMLVLAGVNAGQAVVATLAYRLASYWLPLIAGGVAYLLFRRRYGPIRNEDRRPASPPP